MSVCVSFVFLLSKYLTTLRVFVFQIGNFLHEYSPVSFYLILFIPYFIFFLIYTTFNRTWTHVITPNMFLFHLLALLTSFFFIAGSQERKIECLFYNPTSTSSCWTSLLVSICLWWRNVQFLPMTQKCSCSEYIR